MFWHDVIFSHCYVEFRHFRVAPNNWGDDINKYFFEHITTYKFAVLPCGARILFGHRHYSLIGSILGAFSLNNCIVYGTGLMTSLDKVSGKPERIISVRGPLTRKALIAKGYDCPENYGDPALLLPLFYEPSQRAEKFISVIPNCATFWEYSPVLEELTGKYHCKLINMTRYKNWTDIIDEITSSTLVISESLHGLIVAEAYNIPCVWVEFINHYRKFNSDWSFKFRDFYQSIGKFDMTSIKLYEGFEFDELVKHRDTWRPSTIDYERILESFPFEINQTREHL